MPFKNLYMCVIYFQARQMPKCSTMDVQGIDQDGRVVCQTCNKRVSQLYLVEHMRRHEGRFRYYCSLCKKGFLGKTHYVGHMNKHSNKRPFVCPKCGAGFLFKFHMTSHYMSCCQKQWLLKLRQRGYDIDILTYLVMANKTIKTVSHGWGREVLAWHSFRHGKWITNTRIQLKFDIKIQCEVKCSLSWDRFNSEPKCISNQVAIF